VSSVVYVILIYKLHHSISLRLVRQPACSWDIPLRIRGIAVLTSPPARLSSRDMLFSTSLLFRLRVLHLSLLPAPLIFLLGDDSDIAPCSTNHATGDSSAAAPSSMDVEQPRSAPGGSGSMPPSGPSTSSSTGGSVPAPPPVPPWSRIASVPSTLAPVISKPALAGMPALTTHLRRQLSLCR
jgi:hypothetical protein